MDAIREWRNESPLPRVLVTSLDALLQRTPPPSSIDECVFGLKVGARFDRESFLSFADQSGYQHDAIVDEPGEVAVREGVVEIFPAGGIEPMRVVIGDDNIISELRFYDPISQRSVSSVEQMKFGPATELVGENSSVSEGAGFAPSMERRLFHLFGDLFPMLDLIRPAFLVLADGMNERLELYLDIIQEARLAQRDLGAKAAEHKSLYLSGEDWAQCLEQHEIADLNLTRTALLPEFNVAGRDGDGALAFVVDTLERKHRVLVTGTGGRLHKWIRSLETRLGQSCAPVSSFEEIEQAEDKTLFLANLGLEKGFIDEGRGLTVVTSSDILGADSVSVGNSSWEAMFVEPEIQIGDVVVHVDHGVGVLDGLEFVELGEHKIDVARLRYHGGALLLVPMQEFGRLWRYSSEPDSVTLDRLHSDAWRGKRLTVSKEIEISASKLIKIVAARASEEIGALVPDQGKYTRFVSRFPYPETSDQAAAVTAVLDDLASGIAMNRLVCGDVGFGKTEVALRATAAAVFAGTQVIVLVPTTVLAKQHFLTFERRFSGTGVGVSLLSRLVSGAEAKRVKHGLKDGTIRVVVATSAILSKEIDFNRLGLLIIDEEHKFGAKDKAAIGAFGPAIHTLAMTATPIPRTLQHALVGLQDVSVLATPPAKRRPVRTILATFDPASVRTAMLREKRRGGQSFVVVPRIEDIEGIRKQIESIVPELSLVVAHGKMPAADVDHIITSFADGEGDILLSTNIVESGLDVPRANTVFICRARNFGLAQLHQLRGRVGRGRAQGTAFLLHEAGEKDLDEAQNRLDILIANDRLGDGVTISLRDLALRGAGDLFGEDQAGHLKVIGTGLYQKMLSDAVVALKGDTGIHPARAEISIGDGGRIPEDFVPEATVRLNLYARLLKLSTRPEIEDFAAELEDRFGSPPAPVEALLRLSTIAIAAASAALTMIEGGPAALAVTFREKPSARNLQLLGKVGDVIEKDGRYLIVGKFDNFTDRLSILELALAV